MSTMDSDPSRPGVKTLAIRLDPELHAQLSLVAQLRGKTITDEIRTAIETHIESVKTAPELIGKAEGVLEEIERDATARRAAIATLFGSTEPTATPPPNPAPSGPAAASQHEAPAGRQAGTTTNRRARILSRILPPICAPPHTPQERLS